MPRMGKLYVVGAKRSPFPGALAIVALLADSDIATAEDRLARSAGSVRRAVARRP